MTLEDLFTARRSTILVVAELGFTTSKDEDVTEYFSTSEFTVAQDMATAPGRHYSPRLRYPTLPWSRHREDAAGGSSAADTTTLEIVDLDRRYSHLDGMRLTGDAVVRVGSPDLDLEDWLVTNWRAVSLRRESDSWFVDLEGLDGVFDKAFDRRKLRGLGRCLELGANEEVTIQRASALEPEPAPGPGESSKMAVEFMAFVTGDESFKLVSKGGKGNGGDWTFTHLPSGDIRFGARDTVGIWREIQAPLDHGVPVRVRGQLQDGVLGLYLDGKLAASTPFEASLAASQHNFSLGPGPAVGRFLVDDVRLWVDDLPSIREFDRWGFGELPLMHHYRPAFYFRLNEGVDRESFDDSFNHHKAILPNEDVWSTMAEGPIEQTKLRPFGAGTNIRVSGVPVDEFVFQVHDGAVPGIGPVDEGAGFLWPQRMWSGGSIIVVPGTGEETTATISTQGEHDFGGLIYGQWVRVTSTQPGAEQSVLCELARPSEPGLIELLPLEPLTTVLIPDHVTIETAGYEDTFTGLRFDGNRILGEDIRGNHQVGSKFTVAGSVRNDGEYTLVSMSSNHIEVQEDFEPENAQGVAVTLSWVETWDYTVQLDAGTITLLSLPTDPEGLAIDFRGPGGDTRASLARYVAEHFGVTDFDQASLEAFAAEDSEAVGFWLGPEEDPDGREVLDDLLGPDSWGFNARGEFELAIRKIPDQAGLELDFHNHFYDLGRTGVPKASLEQMVRWGQNYVVLSEDDLIFDNDPTRAGWAQEKWRESLAPVYPLLDPPEGAEAGPVIDSAYAGEVGAFAMAERIFEQEMDGVQIWQGTANLRILLASGRQDAVLLTSTDHSELGEDGKILLILRLDLNTDTMQVLVTLWRPENG